MLNTDFQRVKTLWQTRMGGSRSAGSHDVPTTLPEEWGKDDRQSPVNEVQTPQTPAVDVDFHQGTAKPSEKFVSSTEHDHGDSAVSSTVLLSTVIPSSGVSPEAIADTSLLTPVISIFKTLPSSKNKPPPTTAFVSARPLALFSYSPPIRTPWKSSRSASDTCLNSSLSTPTSGFSFASVNLTSATLPPREAAENAINNVHNVCPRSRAGLSRSISWGSPYGELFIVDILEAKGLVINRDEIGSCLPFAITMQLGCTSQQTTPVDPSSLIVNERFVLWIPSSPTIEQRTIDMFVHQGNDRELGEVHLSLAMPLNEAFGDWFPLVCRADGLKHGSLRVKMRRLVLTSSPMVEAAKILGKRKSCLSFNDSRRYGNLLPELYHGFPGQEPEVVLSTTSPIKDRDTVRKFSRLIGVYPDVQRDVF